MRYLNFYPTKIIVYSLAFWLVAIGTSSPAIADDSKSSAAKSNGDSNSTSTNTVAEVCVTNAEATAADSISSAIQPLKRTIAKITPYDANLEMGTVYCHEPGDRYIWNHQNLHVTWNDSANRFELKGASGHTLVPNVPSDDFRYGSHNKKDTPNSVRNQVANTLRYCCQVKVSLESVEHSQKKPCPEKNPMNREEFDLASLDDYEIQSVRVFDRFYSVKNLNSETQPDGSLEFYHLVNDKEHVVLDSFGRVLKRTPKKK